MQIRRITDVEKLAQAISAHKKLEAQFLMVKAELVTHMTVKKAMTGKSDVYPHSCVLKEHSKCKGYTECRQLDECQAS